MISTNNIDFSMETCVVHCSPLTYSVLEQRTRTAFACSPINVLHVPWWPHAYESPLLFWFCCRESTNARTLLYPFLPVKYCYCLLSLIPEEGRPLFGLRARGLHDAKIAIKPQLLWLGCSRQRIITGRGGKRAPKLHQVSSPN